MLSAPFVGSTKPRPPPPRFGHRAQTMYHSANPFSTHDNRHTIQDRGEYFGDGRDTRFLGRKLLQPLHTRLHFTGQDFLKHYSRNPVDHDYNTIFGTSFTGKPTDEPPPPAGSKRAGQTPSGPVPLSTTTTEWFPQDSGTAPEDVASKPGQPSTRVLAISQQPYPKHNTWKYSYKGLPRVYPPYGEPIKVTEVDNVFNRYGAAFGCASAPAAATEN